MSDSYGSRAGRANACDFCCLAVEAIGLHAGAALEARGFMEVFPSRALSGVFTQFEWYRGLSFVSIYEAAAFSFMLERKNRKEE